MGWFVRGRHPWTFLAAEKASSPLRTSCFCGEAKLGRSWQRAERPASVRDSAADDFEGNLPRTIRLAPSDPGCFSSLVPLASSAVAPWGPEKGLRGPRGAGRTGKDWERAGLIKIEERF